MNKVRGFTLIELMVVVALIAIGTVIAMPSLRSMVRNNLAAAQANELVSALSLARSEAIKRGGNVSLCARDGSGSGCAGGTNPDWAQGWLVFVDTSQTGSLDSNDTVLEKSAPLSDDSTLTLSSAAGFITFGANGFLDPAVNASALSFNLDVDGCTGNEKRRIGINLQGQIAVSRTPC